MRIAHLTTVHAPDDVRIYQKEARSLAEAGYDVTLVAPALKEARLEGVRWLRLRRPRGRLDRFFRLTPLAYRAALDSGAEVVHLHDPELIFVGLALKLRGRKVVWDAHEDLPRQILSKPWLHPLLRRPVAWGVDVLERTITRAFDAVVAATPAIARRFPPHKTTVIQNFPLLSEFTVSESIPYNERPNRIVYIGGITAIRGALEMVRAMDYLPSQLEARLVLVGAFSPEGLVKEARSLSGWKYVTYLGRQDRSGVRHILASARVGLHVVHPVDNYKEGYPTKVFEYMAAGVSVVVSDFPLFRKIVERTGAGLVVDPTDPKAIAGAVQWLLEHPDEAEEMGKRGREAVLKEYNWEREAQKLIDLYQRLLGEVIC